jgi:predicted RNA-binding protein Jag
METYEFEGKTDQDAIENACRKLNLSKDQMDITSYSNRVQPAFSASWEAESQD